MVSVKYHSVLPNHNQALCCLRISHDENNKSPSTKTTTFNSLARLRGIQQEPGDSSHGVEKQKYELNFLNVKRWEVEFSFQ